MRVPRPNDGEKKQKRQATSEELAAWFGGNVRYKAPKVKQPSKTDLGELGRPDAPQADQADPVV